MACRDEKLFAHLVAEQYCNILDNKRELFPYYLSNQVVLKWFGRTITGKKDVCEFVSSEMAPTTHILTSVEPAPVHFRSSEDLCASTALPRKTLSAEVEFSQTDYHMTQEKNIAKMRSLAFSDEKTNHHHIEERSPPDVMMMGDTALNMCCASVATKVEEGQGDCVPHIIKPNARFFQARGALQFCRTKQSPTSSKNLKLMSDTMKWERVCKVHVAYNVPPGPNPLNEFEIYRIIYDDTIRCRRNLASEFDKVADETF